MGCANGRVHIWIGSRYESHKNRGQVGKRMERAGGLTRAINTYYKVTRYNS